MEANVHKDISALKETGTAAGAGNTAKTVKPPPRNARPPGGIREFRKKVMQQLQETEALTNDDPRYNRPTAATTSRLISRQRREEPLVVETNEDFVRSSSSPKRAQEERSRNRFDPRFNGARTEPNPRVVLEGGEGSALYPMEGPGPMGDALLPTDAGEVRRSSEPLPPIGRVPMAEMTPTAASSGYNAAYGTGTQFATETSVRTTPHTTGSPPLAPCSRWN